MNGSHDHYAVLGVAKDATETDIKRAWARMVRQHPPDGDPEGNRRLNEAKATLLDPRARAEYDARTQFGTEIDSLFEAGMNAKADEDWTAAVAAFKEILALHPTSHDARNQLAIALCQGGRFRESQVQFERLLNEVPDSALYMSNLAVTLENWGDAQPAGSADERIYYSEAENWIKRAIAAEPYNSAHHRQLARLYRAQDRLADAEKALEDAIGADGKVDVEDIDTMMDLAWLMLIQHRPDRMAGIADRIVAVLPMEAEAREYASHLFLRNAAMLIEDDHLEPAAQFVRAARRITPHFGEHEEWARGIEEAAAARTEAQRMMEEDSIRPKAFALLAGALVDRRTGGAVDDDTMARLVQAVDTWSPAENALAARQIRARYPAVAKLIGDLLTKSGEIAAATPAKTGGGCIIPIALFLLLVALFAFLM